MADPRHTEDNDPVRGWKLLPEDIKAQVSPKEYLWLNNEQRARLLEDFTEPSGHWIDE